MKYLRLILMLIIAVAVTGMVLTSCGNARWGTSAGVDVVWGPGGPRVQPNISMNVYNGGRW